MGPEFVEEDIDPEAEDPGVPEEAAGADELQGLLGRGFLDETQDPTARHLEIAVARLGRIRPDTEGDESTVLCQCDGLIHRAGEGVSLADQVIGRQYEERSCRTPVPAGPQGSGRQRGAGVPGNRLQEKGSRQTARVHGFVFVTALEEELFVGHGQDLGHPRESSRPLEGFLEQAPPVCEPKRKLPH